MEGNSLFEANVAELSAGALYCDGPIHMQFNGNTTMTRNGGKGNVGGQITYKHLERMFSLLGIQKSNTPWQGSYNFSSEKCYNLVQWDYCLLYTSPSPRDATLSRMPSSA